MGAQALAHAGAEAVVLDQDRDQLAEFRFSGAFGKVAQRLTAPLAGAHFESDQRHFLAELRMAGGKLAGNVLNGLVETEAGFDRYHHQVQRIGKRETENLLAFGYLFLEEEARQNP